jgi:S-adenosylmethionine decarboxylase
MFANRYSSGKHILINARGIKNKKLLNDTNALADMMRNICKVYNFQILNEFKHTFSPCGSTIVFVLTESHFSLHSYNEQDFIAMDLYSCRQYEDNNDYETIFNYLLTELDASNKSTCKIIDRYF